MNKYFKPVSFLFVFALAFNGYQPAHGQTAPPQARKFDEFGDILMTEIKARLDNYAVQLQSEPDARGFIIIYRSRRDIPGLNARLGLRMKYYLVDSRRIASANITTVDGGVAACLTQELWIVPKGTAPTPRSDAYSHSYVDIDSVRKFDEYTYVLPSDTWDAVEDIEGGDSLEAFAAALRKEPHSSAYIILYPRYYVDVREEYEDDRKIGTERIVHLDSPGTSAKVLRALKAELSSRYRIAPHRIKLMNGGHRKWRQVELWIVPRGQHAPVPTPNTFPPKARKGKG